MNLLDFEMNDNPIAISYEAMEDLLVIGDWGFEVSVLFENHMDAITVYDHDWDSICKDMEKLQ